MALAENTELQNRLISEARKSLHEDNDVYMAKSWFLTASCMFPNSFKIQVSIIHLDSDLLNTKSLLYISYDSSKDIC